MIITELSAEAPLVTSRLVHAGHGTAVSTATRTMHAKIASRFVMVNPFSSVFLHLSTSAYLGSRKCDRVGIRLNDYLS